MPLRQILRRPHDPTCLAVTAVVGTSAAGISSHLPIPSQVIYLETHKERFELSWDGSAIEGEIKPEDVAAQDSYSWSRCKAPLPIADMLSVGMPLPASHVEVRRDGFSKNRDGRVCVFALHENRR